MVLDPIYLANLVLSINNCYYRICFYKINKNEVAIYVAIGFLLFGFTHFSFLVGLREPLDRYIFVIRIISYVVIIYGLYGSWRQTKTQITALSNKNKQLEIEIRELIELKKR